MGSPCPESPVANRVSKRPRISADVSERLGMDATGPDSQLLWHQLRQVLRRCEQTVELSWLGSRWRALGWVYWWKYFIQVIREYWKYCGDLTLVALCWPPLAYWVDRTDGRSPIVALSAGLVAAFVIVFVIVFAVVTDRKAVVQSCREHESRLAWQCYQQIWRPLIEQHLRLTHQSYRLLIEQLEYERDDINSKHAATNHLSKYTAAIHAHASKDYALRCLALALRFLR